MVRMTKEEATYPPYMHCLLRAVPGIAQYHTQQVQMENISSEMQQPQNATGLLGYYHSERNVESKLKELGISKSLTTKIFQDIYAEGSGLLRADSKEELPNERKH